uniref:TonB-dependent hemoglobin/transferrin/lactoferrin family receptor n=1 Tax=Ningiella ruwaisensis TaxID=2364274 RepID=UPI00109F0EDE|nr:TonB-dependent hemoglobin/transferrin/lactoferrin family receptor [Ningiella ruwaisensis]
MSNARTLSQALKDSICSVNRQHAAVTKSLLFSLALFFSSTLLNNAVAMAVEAETVPDNGFETISVTGTRTMREINEIAASVTRIESQQIDAISANNIRDMLRYEPGISVEGNGRYGLSSFNIRGINGDRVLILLDGVPVADEFSFGPNLSSRRDFIDIDLISAVDIVRGPASTLYGSDAIGGVVAFTSKAPEDIIKSNNTIGGRIKLGYDSQSNERMLNAMLGGISGNWQYLFNAAARYSDENESFFSSSHDTGINFGSERKSADPQENDQVSALAKIIYQASDAHRFQLTLDALDQQSDTELLSESGIISRGVLTQNSVGEDKRERSRISFDYRYTPTDALLNLTRIQLLSFYQNSLSEQDTFAERLALDETAQVSSRERHSEFEQDITGVSVQFDHQFKALVEHYLIYGLSYEKTKSTSLREGATFDAQSGEALPEFSIFPARDFPPSELTERAIFIQNEMSFFDEKLRLSPGIRYDSFSLNVEEDALFSAANPGVNVENYDDSQASAKLGLVFSPNKSLSLWYQYAEGFRIPPMDDVNIGFTNFAGGYTSLSNPELEAESVTSHEVGLRVFRDAFDFSVSVYDNQYDNFIESLALVGFNPQTRLLEFQARNLDSVNIKGLDAQATIFLGEINDAMENWLLRMSYSRQLSEDKSTGNELDSILPSQGVLGISYGDYDAKYRVELAATYTDEANVIEAAADSPAFFQAPSYTLLDLIGHYQISEDIRINAGLFNLTDKEYYLASEVRGRTVSENLGRFSASGRHLSANLIWTF